jgi:tol-pal system protein YbgF
VVHVRMKSLSIFLLTGALTVGCGAGRETVKHELEEVKRELADLNESHKALNQRYENLQDRLALVEDRGEAQALQRRVRPPLPVVRVVPPKDQDLKPPALPPATITQADVDRLSGYKVAKRETRRAVVPPANAARAGNVGVRTVPPRQLPMGGPRLLNDDPLAAYKRAKDLYNGGNVSGSIKALTSFIRRWPDHGYADNALYLLGSGRYKRAEYRAALDVFRRVLSDHATGNQVPDALLMTGLTLERLGQPMQARDTLSRLRAMYPGTDAARRAADALATFDGRR